MNKAAVVLVSFGIAAISLTGCAHTGLVTGPSVSSTAVDRTELAEQIANQAAEEDAAREATVPRIDVESLWNNEILPEDKIAILGQISGAVSETIERVENFSEQFAQNLPTLDTSLPEPELPENQSFLYPKAAC
jgi:hypothetical protein